MLEEVGAEAGRFVPVTAPLHLALAGDTMLGRGVAQAIADGREPLLDPEAVAVAGGADLFLLNLE